MPTEIIEGGGTAAIVAATAAVLNTETAGKLYEDLRPIAQQIGKAGELILEIITAPLQVAASHAKRVVWLVQAANGQIPEDRLVTPAPSIAGAIFENVKYLENESPLLKLYEQLLVSAMDRDRVADAHPAFPSLIGQLSPDEAVLLYHIARRRVTMLEKHRVYNLGTDQETRGNQTLEMEIPIGLRFAHHIPMYRAHLMALNLVNFLPIPKSNAVDADENGVPYILCETPSSLFLSEFGELFSRACIPKTWDIADQGAALARPA